MGFRKFNVGNILRSREEKQEQKIAAKNFSDEDREALRQENQEDCGSEECRCRPKNG